jgi:hypothetical protein
MLIVRHFHRPAAHLGAPLEKIVAAIEVSSIFLLKEGKERNGLLLLTGVIEHQLSTPDYVVATSSAIYGVL